MIVALMGLSCARAGMEPAASPSSQAPDASAEASTASSEPALLRITSSFEVKHAAAVLKQVARVFKGGFTRRDAERLARQIDAMPAEQSQRWQFNAIHKGVSYPLQVRARLDDFGMLDLDFFTAAPMAGAVRAAVDGYLNSRGL